MKYILLFLSFITCSIFTSKSSFAEDAVPSSVKFDKTVHDFGNLPQGKPVTYDFEFTNKGKEPIELENVKASCGCTTPTWTKEPVLENKKGVIKAQYNMAREGAFDKTITVTIKGGEQIILHIKGNAIAQKQGVDDADGNMLGGKNE